MTLGTLKDLYIEQLRDVHNAEQQLVNSWPTIASQASHSELQDAFESHLRETRTHAQRLERIFETLDENPHGEKCEGMAGLIEETNDLLEKDADDDVRDAGLIAAAQRVEHYEIAAYGTLAAYADRLDRSEEHRGLSQTLEEEKKADRELSAIAMKVVNPDAVPA